MQHKTKKKQKQIKQNDGAYASYVINYHQIKVRGKSMIQLATWYRYQIQEMNNAIRDDSLANAIEREDMQLAQLLLAVEKLGFEEGKNYEYFTPNQI